MGPFEREFPPVVFDGIESEMDCMVRRVSSVLIPRPTRTMISENCTEEQKREQGRRRRVFRGFTYDDALKELRARKQKSMRGRS